MGPPYLKNESRHSLACPAAKDQGVTCVPPYLPLCGRDIPPDVPQSKHHLIPKLKGGKGGPVVLMHHICHREIHASLTEAELAREYNTPEALRGHPRLAKFAAWVAKRPPGFRSKVPGGMRKK